MPNRLNVKALVEFKPEDRKLIGTGDLEMQFQPDDKTYAQGIQTIGTSEESLSVGDVDDIGLIVIINRDDTNYVEVGLSNNFSIKLKAGQFCLFPPADTIVAQANESEVDIEYYIFPEDT